MTDELVIVTGPDPEGTAVCTLNAPAKHNVLSTAMRDRISEALDALAEDAAVKALVIHGAGRCFSAGFDLDEFADDDEEHRARLWASSDRFHETVRSFPVPTVAAVHGVAYGGGFDLAVLCDIRLAGRTARFAHPEAAFGRVVYGPLHDLVGGAIARELVLTGRRIDADEAERLHLVSEVVQTTETLLERAMEMAHLVSRAPRHVLVQNKAKFLARSAIAPGTPTLEL